MRALLDSDFFAKLAGPGLLEPVLKELGLGLADCACLGGLRHKLKRGSWARALGPAASDLEALAAKIATVPDHSPTPLRERLTQTHGIDGGEALLLATAAESTTLVLCTGDKRALRALAALPDIGQALSGRVVTVEAAFLVLCGVLGVHRVKTAYMTSPQKDNAITCAFSMGVEEEVLRGLMVKQQELEDAAGAGLLWSPAFTRATGTQK